MHAKIAISAYIFEKSRKGPFSMAELMQTKRQFFAGTVHKLLFSARNNTHTIYIYTIHIYCLEIGGGAQLA